MSRSKSKGIVPWMPRMLIPLRFPRVPPTRTRVRMTPFSIATTSSWIAPSAAEIRSAADDASRLCERVSSEWAARVADIWAELSSAENVAVDGRAADRKWRPSIFLPRWASRITLAVTAVRVERLQEISELDALDEGVEGKRVTSVLNGVRGEYVVGSARDAYAALWDTINGDRAPWASNPWVWVVEFSRVEAGQ